MQPGLRVVFAPDSFKGTSSAEDAARAICGGWRTVRPHDTLVIAPMADGGEGTIDALAALFPGAQRRPARVRGPVGTANCGNIDAEWLWLPASGRASALSESGRASSRGATGVVELAAASGILHLDAPAPMIAHTYGFGQLIGEALDAGVHRLLLAIGGSASTDGGAGALTALGARFSAADGTALAPGGGGLRVIAAADLSGLRNLPPGGALVLSDVSNPLTGARGAAAVFGPQKGATPEEVVQLERALTRFAGLMPTDPTTPGAGAAGGTGFSLQAWGATIECGSRVVAEAIGLPALITAADVVVTGEGRFDRQSSAGKVPSFVAGLAAASGVSAMLVAGRIDAPTGQFAAAVSLEELAGGAGPARAEAARWLREAGAMLARSLHDGNG